MAREEAEIKELSKKLAQNPDSLVFAPLADSQRRLGKIDEAIDTCLKGLQLHPTYMTARVILGRAYFDKNMLDEAIGEFKTIENADPNNIMAHSMLGQIYMKKGLFAEAIEEHQKVLALNPDDVSAQSLLNEALEKARQIPVAVTPEKNTPNEKQIIASAVPVTVPSKEKLATITVAEIYIKKGALDEAVEVFKEILATDPENFTARQKLTEVLALKGQNGKSSENNGASSFVGSTQVDPIEKENSKVQSSGEQTSVETKKIEISQEEKKAASDLSQKKSEQQTVQTIQDPKDRFKKEEAIEVSKKTASQSQKETAGPASETNVEIQTEEKITPDDILSVMKINSPDEVIIEEQASPEPPKVDSKKVELRQSSDPAVASAAPEASKNALPSSAAAESIPQVESSKFKSLLSDFNKNQGIQGCLLVNYEGVILENVMSQVGQLDFTALGALAASIFKNTEKAVLRMRQGKLNHIMVTGEDGRQIIFAHLNFGILTAIANKNANIGLVRIALNELIRKAA